MLIQRTDKFPGWDERTMSALNSERLEACEKKLAGLPSVCIFDSDCSDDAAEKLYAFSYYFAEDQKPELHTAISLRSRVLQNFPSEIHLLSQEEHDLLIKMILVGGSFLLASQEDLIPAESLIRRMFCKLDMTSSPFRLSMPHQLCTAGLLLIAADSHKEYRSVCENILDTVDNSLYLYGIVQMDTVLKHISKAFEKTVLSGRNNLFRRIIYASYRSTFDRNGKMLLIHPGLFDPGRAIIQREKMISLTMADPDELSAAYRDLEDLEEPLYSRMLNAIQDSVRPDTSPEDTVEDLIILSKQDVPISGLREVLSARLYCHMTDEMISALRDLHDRIPRWFPLNMFRVQ